MAQQASFVESGFDRIQDALKSIESDVEKFQSRVETQRKRLERETRKRVGKFRKEITETPFAKRAEKFSKDASREIGSRVEDVLGALSIASNADLKKVNRKLNQINRRLKALEEQDSKKTPSGVSS